MVCAIFELILGRKIKWKAVAIPVMLTGGVKTLEDVETLLKNDGADLIGVGREILKNPYWLKEQMKD